MSRRARQKGRREERRRRAERREERLKGAPRPRLEAGQVYATGGRSYHTEWCPAINGVWLAGAQTVVPLALDVARARGLTWCSLCREQVVGE